MRTVRQARPLAQLHSFAPYSRPAVLQPARRRRALAPNVPAPLPGPPPPAASGRSDSRQAANAQFSVRGVTAAAFHLPPAPPAAARRQRSPLHAPLRARAGRPGPPALPQVHLELAAAAAAAGAILPGPAPAPAQARPLLGAPPLEGRWVEVPGAPLVAPPEAAGSASDAPPGAAGTAGGMHARIINGEAAGDPWRFPYAAWLGWHVTPNSTSVCGATLITPRHLLTAAHCVAAADGSAATPDALRASLRGQRLEVSAVEVHEGEGAVGWCSGARLSHRHARCRGPNRRCPRPPPQTTPP